MGLAASSYNLLKYTRRGNDVRCQLTQLSMQKMALTQDMNKISKEYQRALSSKTLKWTNNAGADYVDLTYSNLMYPKGSINNNKLTMITDMNGKVVVDEKYQKYAAMISPDGNPGNWEANRSVVLSQLVGISASDIDNAEDYYLAIQNGNEEVAHCEASEPDKRPFTRTGTASLLEKLGGSWASDYSSDKKVSASEIPGVLDNLKNGLSKYFLGSSKDSFESACDLLSISMISDTTMKDIVRQLAAACGSYITNSYDGSAEFVWYDTDSDAYNNYEQAHAAWEVDMQNANNNLNNAVTTYNNIFTADVQTQFSFYDDLFSSIAEHGWCYYDQVSEPDYLNQMLQNGMFNLMTVERGLVDDGRGGYRYMNAYDTEIAVNCPNIVQVSDSDYRDDALVKYQHEKDIINAKETKIDIRMDKLKVEQDAITKMIDSIQKVMENNIEQHMNIFNA